MLYNVDSFDNKQYVFTNYRVNTIGRLLWNFDELMNKCEYKGEMWYVCSDKNNDISIMINEDSMNKYTSPNKYTFLLTQIISQNFINSKTNTIRLSFKEIEKLTNVNLKKYDSSIIINELKLLDLFYIRFNKYKGNIVIFSKFIEKFLLEEDFLNITIGDWTSHILYDTEFNRNEFLLGIIDYKPFVKGGNNKTECMDLPQKIAELYRINANKKSVRVYQNYKYFEQILNTKKVLRRKFIESVINNLNDSISKVGLCLVFDCDYTPNKFKNGCFAIKKISDVINND